MLLVIWKIQSFQELLLNWARTVFVLLSRILLVDFSPHVTVQLCCQLFFNRLVVCYKRFEVGDQTYISVESFRNKILISGMSSAGMINNFCCKQSWSNCLQNNVKNNKPNSSNKQTPQQTQSQTGPSIWSKFLCFLKFVIVYHQLIGNVKFCILYLSLGACRNRQIVMPKLEILSKIDLMLMCFELNQ